MIVGINYSFEVVLKELREATEKNVDKALCQVLRKLNQKRRDLLILEAKVNKRIAELRGKPHKGRGKEGWERRLRILDGTEEVGDYAKNEIEFLEKTLEEPA